MPKKQKPVTEAVAADATPEKAKKKPKKKAKSKGKKGK